MSGEFEEQNQSIMRNLMECDSVCTPALRFSLKNQKNSSEVSQRQRAEKSMKFSEEESPFRDMSSSHVLG